MTQQVPYAKEVKPYFTTSMYILFITKFPHNSSKLETNQTSIHRRMDKLCVTKVTQKNMTQQKLRATEHEATWMNLAQRVE